MAKLVIPSRRQPNEQGSVLTITPESAGWTYVGFELLVLAAGQSLRRATNGRETCLVLLAGRADVSASGLKLNDIGRRMQVFEQIPPFSVYVPAGDIYTVTALTRLEVAVCTAPGQGTFPARLITPDEVDVEIRGSGCTERRIHHLLPERAAADSLLVVEVFTPGGHWSSYPPHKHDTDRPPHESYLEETYYHRIKPDTGFAVQRVYSSDGTLDETMTVRDGDAVLVPRGYHPVASPPDFDLYYLNVMAGPNRTWKYTNDPVHVWRTPGGEGGGAR